MGSVRVHVPSIPVHSGPSTERAVVHGDVEICATLLEARANVHATNADGVKSLLLLPRMSFASAICALGVYL